MKLPNESLISHRIDYISVCICTYKRPRPLERLLVKLQDQETKGLFRYSIVVVDNDHMQSAKGIVKSFGEKSSIAIDYYCEPEQNISLARNKAVQNAKGNFVAFIDDDELPVNNWLLNLYKAYHEFNADGILGPVMPYYEIEPPQWIIKGKFYERPSHKTGAVLHWTNTRTGNVLLRKNIFSEKENMFRLEFGRGGEDRDFFRRMIERGFHFVWCAEAPVYETVAPERFKRSFMVRRALVRGQNPHFGLFDILKSLIAVPLYTLALPLLLFLSHHIFMKYLIKDFDHIGRILAFWGIDVVRDQYVMK